MKNIPELEKKLGIKFKNKDILIEATTHRSYINEHPEFHLNHNERLEFLGDAVLELIVTEYLYKNYPQPEGILTNWRASLVNRANLSKIAEELEIESFVSMSRGEAKDKKTKARQVIISNAVEAIIGAIFLDQKITGAKKFIKKNILSKLPEIIEQKLYIDPKSNFQERAQEKIGQTPIYQIINSQGPDHAKKFKVGVYLGKEFIAAGSGSSKQEAQVKAAQKALKKKKW